MINFMYFVQTFEGQNSEVGPKSTPLNMFSDIIVYVQRCPQLQPTNCNKPCHLCFTPQQPELQILQAIIPKTNSSLIIEWGTYARHFSCSSPRRWFVRTSCNRFNARPCTIFKRRQGPPLSLWFQRLKNVNTTISKSQCELIRIGWMSRDNKRIHPWAVKLQHKATLEGEMSIINFSIDSLVCLQLKHVPRVGR